MKRIDEKAKTKLQLAILSLVKAGVSSVNLLLDKAIENELVFDKRLFYPALSGLNRTNCLCWCWKYSEGFAPEKHFFITSAGEKLLL